MTFRELQEFVKDIPERLLDEQVSVQEESSGLYRTLGMKNSLSQPYLLKTTRESSYIVYPKES